MAGDHLGEGLAQRVEACSRGCAGRRARCAAARWRSTVSSAASVPCAISALAVRSASSSKRSASSPLKVRQMRSKRCRGARVDEQAVHEVGEAVAGGAVHRPASRQLLVRGDDLLHHHVERRAGACARPLGGAAGALRVALLQALEVAGRVVAGRRDGRCAGRRPCPAPPGRAPGRASPRTPSARSMRSAASSLMSKKRR